MGVMTKKLKRIMAILLSAAMLITVVPQNGITVLAAEAAEEENLRETSEVTKDQAEIPATTPKESEALQEETSEETGTPAEEIPEETEAPQEETPEETETPAGETPKETETPEATPELTPGQTQMPTEVPEELPEETETPTATPEGTPMETAELLQKASATPSLTPKAEETADSFSDEYTYQEGAFDVVAETESGSSNSVKAFMAVNWEKVDAYIYQQLKAKKTEISLTSFNIPRSDDTAYMLSNIINENADLYFVDISHSLYYIDGSNKITKLKVSYYKDYDDDAFDRAVEDALSVIRDGMDDLDKAVALHDYLVLNCEYYPQSPYPKKAYTAYGALVDGQAVCQGYALAYKYLLKQAGVNAYMVTSSTMNHAWNLVELNGNYYQVDVTWDDPLADRIGYVYHNNMLVSDATLENRQRHSNWKVTYGNKKVELSATDTGYDDAFWTDCCSPLVYESDSYYYIDRSRRSIMRRDGTGMTVTLLEPIGIWYAPGGGYYSSPWSGLYLINGRLYYNDPDYIYSIALDGTDKKAMSAKLSTASEYIYGSVFRKGRVEYVLRAEPDYSSREEILEAELSEQPKASVSKLILSKDKIVLSEKESLLLKVSVVPSYVDLQDLTWTTSDPSVAEVENGLVSAVGGGSCTVTVSAGGKSASCEVTVRQKLKAPEFSAPGGTIDKGSEVTITAEEGSVIYYTVNGTDPGTSANKTTKQYTAPVKVDRDMTIKAIAVSNSEAYSNSDIASVKYQACTNDLVLKMDKIELTEGGTAAIGIMELPTTKTAEDVTWSISDMTVERITQADQGERVASIDSATGEITAEYAGTATVTASVQDHKGETVTASCDMLVKRPLYTVTFIGLEGTEPVKQQVEARKNAEAPVIMLPEGYEYKGWSVKGEETDLQELFIEEDTTIKLEYGLTTYTVSYHTNGGAGMEAGSYTVETDTFVLPEAADKEGYIFAGWYTDEQLAGDRIFEVVKGSTGNIELYAAWKDERELWLQADGTDRMNEIPAQAYTGKAIKPVFTVYYGSKELKKGTDYTVSYKNNTSANLLETDQEKKKAPTVTIKGKGNYTGTLTKTFQITKKNIEDSEGDSFEIQIDDLAAAYNRGKLIKPVPVVSWGGKKLKNKKDFTVSYPELADSETAYRDPGTYQVQISGCGNYEGTRTIGLTITDPKTEKLLSKVKAAKIPDQVYSGSRIELTMDMPKLTDGKYRLVPDTDYTFAYAEGDDGTAIGTHTVIITGMGKYVGTRRITFKIKGKAISTVKINKLPKLTYTGEALTFDPDANEDALNKLTVTDKSGAVLKNGEDYTLAFTNNINAGTAKMTIKGIGKYSGTVTKTFKIVPDTLGDTNKNISVSFVNGDNEQSYEKNGAKPKVKVIYTGGKEEVVLTEGKDYTLSYRNNTSVNAKANKPPTVTIKGKKNFAGSRSVTFTIAKKDISGVKITAPDLEENAKAGKYMSVPVLTDKNGKKLKAGTDYEKTYIYRDANGMTLGKTARPRAGATITVTVKGKGNYTGETSTTFRILGKGKNISKAKVTVKNKIYYNGDKVTLSKDDLTVKVGKITLSADDYTIIGYSNNHKKGTAKVTIQGIGNYGGTKTISFKILSYKMKWWEKPDQ